MKLKADHVLSAARVVTNIINRQAPMPQRGKYLLARLHSKLMPEFKVIDARLTDMIKAYNNPQVREIANDDGSTTIEPVPGEWQVPAGKMPEFTAAWKEIGDEEVEVDIQPIPLSSLCMPNGTEGLIESSEFIVLGDLVYDNAS